jgi:carbon starvation protein CstA
MVYNVGCAIVQAVSDWPCTMESCIQSQASVCGICNEYFGTGTGLSVSVFLFQYHTIKCSVLIYLSPVLYNLNL